MKAYSYDENGVFIRECNCQPNPVRPGSFLIPGHATATPPPEFDPETQKAVWNGSEWRVEDIPPTPEPEPLPEPGLDDITMLKLAVAELAETMFGGDNDG